MILIKPTQKLKQVLALKMVRGITPKGFVAGHPARDLDNPAERCARSGVEIDNGVIREVERLDTRVPRIHGHSAELEKAFLHIIQEAGQEAEPAAGSTARHGRI